jgi:hypothetical protein
MASNDPTDTGGLFIGRRPGTRPVRLPVGTKPSEGRRRTADKTFAAFLLFLETLLCISVWGPQPLFWLWFGSQVNYWTDSVEAGIASAFVGMLATLFITLGLARRVDHAWKLVRRAAGYRQERGALERIFVVALIIVGSAFMFWFLIISGPGSSIVPGREQ